jgi:hypothetical protein
VVEEEQEEGIDEEKNNVGMESWEFNGVGWKVEAFHGHLEFGIAFGVLHVGGFDH